MPLPLELVIDGPPVSQQTKSKRRLTEWKREVRLATEREWRTAAPFPGEVTVSVTNFFTHAAPDVDNVPKPILDAFKELIYTDDSQVSDLCSSKRAIRRVLRVQNPTLQVLLHRGRPFLHITVDETPSHEGVGR